MKTDKEIFQEAYALVKNPDTWCQGALVLDERNRIVEDFSDGVKFCSVGALAKTAGDFQFVKIQLKNEARQALSVFNDTHTHAEVCDLWEKVGRDNGWL